VLDGTPILVTVARDRERVGVRRAADDSLWLAQWSEDESQTVSGVGLVGFEPGVFWSDDWLGVGGLLPAGAFAVAVLDRAGTWQAAGVATGAWAAIVADDLGVLLRDSGGKALGASELMRRVAVPPIVFRNAKGVRVCARSRAELRASRRVRIWERALSDLAPHGVRGRCPVCAKRRWRALRVPAERGIGEHYFCGRCGYSDYLVR
jgi:hypothetical protein